MSAEKNRLVVRSDKIFTADGRHGAKGADASLFDGYLLIEGETIVDVAAGDPDRELLGDATYLNARGNLVVPGFIDPHTHLVHGGERAFELKAKLEGKTYLELHETGGIRATMRATRDATEAELEAKAKRTLARMLRFGVTTVEAKSGYGLDLETELKCLRVAATLAAAQPVEIVSTFMGAHAVPPEFASAEAYIDYQIETVLPEVAASGLAQFADVFCEEGIFSVAESRRYLLAARDLGFSLKVHADEIVNTGGAELAADVAAVSAEHLMAVSERGIARMAEAGVVACLLPATTYYLMTGTYAPARALLDAGVKVALATDYNPGSSPVENIQLAMSLAVFQMKMRPEEVLRAVTVNAAAAIGRRDIGRLAPGLQADFLVIGAGSLAAMMAKPGLNLVRVVFKRGRLVADNPF